MKFRNFLKKSFLAGFLVVVPALGSALLLWASVVWLDKKIISGLEALGMPNTWHPNHYLPFELPGLGILVFIIVMILIGALARFYFVNYFIALGERLIEKIPFLRTLYIGIKQLLVTLFSVKAD